jgi:hypothetical protein
MKKLAFEYLILKMMDWHMQSKNIGSISEFNQSNSFGIQKMLLIPYFACKASKDNSLFKIFDAFVPEHCGICDSDLRSSLQYQNMTAPIYITDYCLVCNEKEKIGEILQKRKKGMDSQNESLAQQIDEAVSVLKKLNTSFPVLGYGELSFQSKSHASWERYYPLVMLLDSRSEEYKELVKEFRYASTLDPSPYAYNFEERILV